jgi:hypothetical protein
VCDNTAVSAISPTAIPALPDGTPVSRRIVLAILLAAILVAGVPFAAYAAMVLHHFYVSGAFFYDTGQIGALIWHSDLALRTPAVESGNSFYAIHLTPIFVLLLSAISRLLPATLQQFMAGFEGVSHALPALGVFWLLTGPYEMRSPVGVAVAAAISVAFAFNGLALAIARYPHFELLIVAAVILFMAALRSRRPVWAILPFVIGLATREDAGFHFCALLTIMIALDWWYGIRPTAQNAAMAFAIAGLAYSLGAVIFQHAAFSNISGLSRIYLGDPPFGRITAGLLADRLYGYLFDRSYIVLPGLCAVVWAILARNPYIVAGYIAFLPWVALHFLADSDLAGSLSGYYAYPLMIASFWPLVGVLLGADRPPAVDPALAARFRRDDRVVLDGPSVPIQSRASRYPGKHADAAVARRAARDRSGDASPDRRQGNAITAAGGRQHPGARSPGFRTPGGRGIRRAGAPAHGDLFCRRV